jgi:hypothetical protein
MVERARQETTHVANKLYHGKPHFSLSGSEVRVQDFKATIVWLILSGKAEEAVEALAEHYRIGVPKLKVGLPKGRKARALGCYTPRNKTISVVDSDRLKDPHVILHEFYHHLRTNIDARHKGNERLASKFAADYIQAYNAAVMARK